MLKECSIKKADLSFENFRSEVLRDYRLAFESRECSLVGRKEVLTGKAKFGIFGDGKELPQLAMARVFKKGDLRSGYYRGPNLYDGNRPGTLPERCFLLCMLTLM